MNSGAIRDTWALVLSLILNVAIIITSLVLSSSCSEKKSPVELSYSNESHRRNRAYQNHSKKWTAAEEVLAKGSCRSSKTDHHHYVTRSKSDTTCDGEGHVGAARMRKTASGRSRAEEEVKDTLASSEIFNKSLQRTDAFKTLPMDLEIRKFSKQEFNDDRVIPRRIRLIQRQRDHHHYVRSSKSDTTCDGEGHVGAARMRKTASDRSRAEEEVNDTPASLEIFNKSLQITYTFETLPMNLENQGIIDDLSRFVGNKELYRSIDRAWKRGYFLYLPPGAGRSSLIVAMANYLKFDIYDFDIRSMSSISELTNMVVSTRNRSLIAIKNFDHCAGMLPNLNNEGLYKTSGSDYRNESSVETTMELTGSCLLKFLDVLLSSCGGEKIIVLTTNHRDLYDAALLHPFNMDIHSHTSSPQPIALPDGGEIVELDSSEKKPLPDFDATINNTYQSGLLVFDSENKNMIEESKRWCMTESVPSLVDSTTRRSSTDFDALDNRAHLVMAHQISPIISFDTEEKGTRDGVYGECLTKSVLSFDDSTKRESLLDFVATENEAHLVRAYQSGPIVFLSQNKNRGESVKEECITKSILDLGDLQQRIGGRRSVTEKSFGTIHDQGFHVTDNISWKSFDLLPREQPNDCLPLSSLGRLRLEGCVQPEKSPDLPRVAQINGVEQRVTKSPRYLGGLTAQSISSSQVVLNPLEQSTKNVAHVARPDQCSPTVPLLEKKMVRRTLKRKCRTISVMFEIHQQHFVKRYEGTAKSFHEMGNKEGIFFGEKRPFEASILSMDEKLVSRFLFIPMSQFPGSSPWPLAMIDGSEIVGPIALLKEFAARKNRAHLVKQNQSGSTASHYERKNTRGTSGRQGIIESTSSTEDLQPHFGCKHEDAVKRLGEQQAFDTADNIAHLVKADQGIPTVSNSELENKRETLKRGCSVLGLEDLRQHYGGRHEDAMKGLSYSLAWRSFKVLESIPLGEQSISRHFALRRALTRKHCVRRNKSQDLPRSLQIDCSGGLAGQSAVSLPDGGYILSPSEKKIVGKTLKRKCRTMSVFSLEDHQQHGVRRWEDAAKSPGRKCICRQLVIQDVSKAKRIRRQHVINQWPFQQNWATIKAYSVGDKRPAEVISLATDGKLVSRLQLIHISWLGKFLPRPSASPGGGETAGPIALLSSDVATNNRAHITRNDQSGSSASHSEKKRPGEPEDLEGTNRSISLEDLEQLFDMKREDAAKILDVSVSKLKRICRQHGIDRWPYRVTNKAVKKPPDRHSGMNTIGSSDDWRNLSASQEEPLLRGHVSGPIYRTISSCTDPAPGQPTPIVPHPTRNLLASEEEVLLWGHVSGPIYRTISSCTEPALSQPMPIGPHPTEDLEDQRNLLALSEEPLLSQITPTIPPTMDGFADWSAVSALFDNSFPEGHASGSIECIVPASSNPAPSQPMPTNATERQNMDFVELKATYGDTTIKFQLPPMFETSELKEKVSKILECELGSFKVEYKDKDGEWILMGCDENVREYLQLLNSLGKQVTKLKISDKVPNTTNLCETCGSSLTRKRPRHVQM